MVAKTLLLVLLGAALVFASPVSKVPDQNEISLISHNTDVLDIRDRSIEDVWGRLEKKFVRAVDDIKVTWEKIKKKGQKIDASFEVIKSKGLKLLRDAKQTYKEIVFEGKEAVAEFKDILENAHILVNNLKQTGVEAYKDVKNLIEEIVTVIRQELAQLKKHKR